MSVPIERIDPADPDRALNKAATALSEGKLVIFPTDTLYGIGARIDREEAIRKIFRIKMREPGKPILILIANPGDLDRYAKKISRQAGEMIDAYWPGPLTLIFEASGRVSTLLTGNRGTIGIRCPGDPRARKLLKLTGEAVTATSANLTGHPPVRSAEEAAIQFEEGIDLILDGGRLGAEPSTVVDVSGKRGARIVRQGSLLLSPRFDEGYSPLRDRT
jgi:L-threonylcarbamoyladenylate synthase